MAAEGYTYPEIARECAVSLMTARKYGAPAKPKYDLKVVFDEQECRMLLALSKAAVKVRCVKCNVLALGFAFLPSTLCLRCGEAVKIPRPKAK